MKRRFPIFTLSLVPSVHQHLFIRLFWQERHLDLTLEGQPSGQLFVKTVFLPAGKLTFVCESARQLRETSVAGRMDSFVVFKAEGQVRRLASTLYIGCGLLTNFDDFFAPREGAHDSFFNKSSQLKFFSLFQTPFQDSGLMLLARAPQGFYFIV